MNHKSVTPVAARPSPLEIKLPAMPQTLTEVMQLRAQSTPDIGRLIEAVKRDPAIAASVLRRVNSAYYSLSRKIVQVEKAVNLLGYKEVYGLMLAAVVKQAFAFRSSEEAGAIYRHIMRNSIAAASFAKYVAAELSPMFVETSLTAGLLHQMGRLVLLSSVPKAYTELWLRLSPSRSLRELVSPSRTMEQFVFRTDHVQIGIALAQQWGLPEEIVTVIRHQEDPAQVTAPFHRSLTLAVAVGSLVATEQFEPVNFEIEVDALLRQLEEVRGVDPAHLNTILAERQQEVRRFAEAMAE